MRSDKYFKHWFLWLIIAPDMIQLVEDNAVDLVTKMVRESYCSWHEIMVAMSYVEAVSTRYVN